MENAKQVWMMWYWDSGMTLSDSIQKGVEHYISKYGGGRNKPNRVKVSDRMSAEDIAVISKTISNRGNGVAAARFVAPRVIWLTYDANHKE